MAHILMMRRLASEWSSTNPILMAGEFGIELDTKQFKIGDGSLPWNNLPYGGGSGFPQGMEAKDVLTIGDDGVTPVWLPIQTALFTIISSPVDNAVNFRGDWSHPTIVSYSDNFIYPQTDVTNLGSATKSYNYPSSSAVSGIPVSPTCLNLTAAVTSNGVAYPISPTRVPSDYTFVGLSVSYAPAKKTTGAISLPFIIGTASTPTAPVASTNILPIATFTMNATDGWANTGLITFTPQGVDNGYPWISFAFAAGASTAESLLLTDLEIFATPTTALYDLNDYVTYEGNLYRCAFANTISTPGTDSTWELVSNPSLVFGNVPPGGMNGQSLMMVDGVPTWANNYQYMIDNIDGGTP